MPGAYSPKTNALYMPLQNTFMQAEIINQAGADGQSNESFGLSWTTHLSPEANLLGRLQAISVETGKTLWQYEQRASMLNVLATGNDLIFAGDSDRRFRAFHAATGEIIWETVLGGSVTGHPISYQVDGIQYVAVSTGSSSLTPVLNDFVGITAPQNINHLYVFALPGKQLSRQQLPFSQARQKLKNVVP